MGTSIASSQQLEAISRLRRKAEQLSSLIKPYQALSSLIKPIQAFQAFPFPSQLTRHDFLYYNNAVTV
jgi:hypothetical protein